MIFTVNEVIKSKVKFSSADLLKIDEQNDLVEKFDGQWIENPFLRYFGCYYIGHNEILNANELYIVHFYNRKMNPLEFNIIGEEMNELIKLVEEDYDLKNVYYQVFLKEETPFELFNQLKGTILSDFIPITYTMTKNIADNPANNKIFELFKIRTANENDMDNVLACLTQAYLNAYEVDLYGEEPLRSLEINVKDYHKPLLKDCLILVAEVNGVFAGHISFEIINRGNKELTPLKLVDIFVVDSYKGLGIGTALIEEGETFALNNNFNLLVGTVDIIAGEKGIHKSKEIIKSLEESYWKRESLIFIKNLRIKESLQ